MLQKGDKIFIIFKSQSFLQNQVRSMVGCLKYLSTYKWDLKNLKKVSFQKIEKIVLPSTSLWIVFKKINY